MSLDSPRIDRYNTLNTHMIYIITPCSRPQNLERISTTIPAQCSWIVVYDNKVTIPPLSNATLMKCEETGYVGIHGQNFALDNLPLTDDDFVLLHDDDNIIHPQWYDSIKEYLSEDFSMLTWGQLNKWNRINMVPTSVPKIGKIDTACFLIRWKYNKYVRHIPDKWEHDGIYAEECAKNGRVLCVDKYIAYYNYLR